MTKDLTGVRFGKLVAVRRTETTRNGHIRWECICDCGNTKGVLATHLNSNKIKSCGCLKNRKGKDNPLWTGYEEISGDWWNRVIHSARGRKSSRREVELTITPEYAWNLFVSQNKRCALSGLLLTLTTGHHSGGTASLDRIDSSLGYIPGNVQWLHKDINWMKNTFEQNYFIEMCRLVGGTCEI